MLMHTAYRGSRMLQIYMHTYCIKHARTRSHAHPHVWTTFCTQNITYSYMHIHFKYCILRPLLSFCSHEDSRRDDALLFWPHIDLKVLKDRGDSHSGPCGLYSAANRDTCCKSAKLLLCSASVWLNLLVWKQGSLPEHTWPVNRWTARLAPITVPHCIISKWTDLYIKIQTTTYSGQAPLKASALRWIKSSDRMMDNPHMRAGPDSVR